MNKASERQKRYDDANTVKVSLKLNVKTDADIINYIDMNNKQASIKQLIRAGIDTLTTKK